MLHNILLIHCRWRHFSKCSLEEEKNEHVWPVAESMKITGSVNPNLVKSRFFFEWSLPTREDLYQE